MTGALVAAVEQRRARLSDRATEREGERQTRGVEVKDRTRETRPSHACMTCLSVVLECTTAPSVLPVTHAALAVEFPTQPLQRSRMQQKCNRRNETLTAVTSGCMQSMISSSRQPTSDHLLSLSLSLSLAPPLLLPVIAVPRHHASRILPSSRAQDDRFSFLCSRVLRCLS